LRHVADEKGYFFVTFITLMLLNVSALHVHTHYDDHDDDVNDCSICELIIQNQQQQHYLANPFESFEIIPIPVFYHQDSGYTSINVSTNIDDFNFGRPPPSIV